jgi:hypothetical protein
MTLFFHLKASVERLFREAAMKKFGYSKGALKTAMEEAITDWLEKQTQSTSETTIGEIKK